MQSAVHTLTHWKGNTANTTKNIGIIKGAEQPDEMACNLYKIKAYKYISPLKAELVLFALTLCASVAIDQGIMRTTA